MKCPKCGTEMIRPIGAWYCPKGCSDKDEFIAAPSIPYGDTLPKFPLDIIINRNLLQDKDPLDCGDIVCVVDPQSTCYKQVGIVTQACMGYYQVSFASTRLVYESKDLKLVPIKIDI